MPKRTNIFQKLIFLINKQLADHAAVSESVLLLEINSGRKREVDIVIEGDVAGYHAVIGIECTGSKRKVSATLMEQLYQKHQNLKTNKVVVVSRAGFTAQALEKAKFYNMEAISLDEALKSNWLARLQSIEMVTIGAKIVGIEIDLTDSLQDAKIKTPVEFCEPEGRQNDLLHLLKTDIVSSAKLAKMLHEILTKDKKINKLVFAIDLQTGKFRDWYISDSEGNHHKMKWYKVYVRISREKWIADFQHANYRGRNVAFSKLPFGSDNAIIAIIEGDMGQANVLADVVKKKKKPGETIYAQYIFTENNELLLSKIDMGKKRTKPD